MAYDLALSQGAVAIRCKVQGEVFGREYTLGEVRAALRRRPEYRALRGLGNIAPGENPGARNTGLGRHVVLDTLRVPTPTGELRRVVAGPGGRLKLAARVRTPEQGLIVTK